MKLIVDDFISSWTETLPSLIKNRRVCLVVDPGVQSAYQIREQVDALSVAKAIAPFSQFTANPTWEALRDGFATAQAIDTDCIVAIGGGTALDLAKLIATAREIGDLDAMWNQYLDGSVRQLRRENHRLVGIPTTAGTGAETTPFAVIYRDGTKHSIAGPALLPDRSVLDPDLLAKLPRTVLIDAGLDAVCQAMESIWSRQSNPDSEKSAWSALELLVQVFPQAVASPTREHLAAMLVGAHLAGRAISITTTTAPHALSYGLTSKLGIPHGRAVAVLFGEIYEATRNALIEAYSDDVAKAHVNECLGRIARTWGQETTGFAPWWRSFLSETLHISVPAQALDPVLIDQLAAGVNTARLSNHPCRFDSNQIRKLYSNLGS